MTARSIYSDLQIQEIKLVRKLIRDTNNVHTPNAEEGKLTMDVHKDADYSINPKWPAEVKGKNY